MMRRMLVIFAFLVLSYYNVGMFHGCPCYKVLGKSDAKDEGEFLCCDTKGDQGNATWMTVF